MLSKIKFARSFPWWYTPLKWGVPLGIALCIGGVTGLWITNPLTIPSMLSTLGGVSTFYQSMGSFSKLAFLTLSTSATSIFSGVVSAMFVRVGLFQYVETLASDNLTRHGILNDLLSERKEQDNSKTQEISKQLSDYQQALVAAEYDNRVLIEQMQYLRAQLGQQTQPETILPADSVFELPKTLIPEFSALQKGNKDHIIEHEDQIDQVDQEEFSIPDSENSEKTAFCDEANSPSTREYPRSFSPS